MEIWRVCAWPCQWSGSTGHSRAGLAGIAALRTGLQSNEGCPTALTKTDGPRLPFTQPNLPFQHPSQATLQPSILLAGDTLCLISYLLGFLPPFMTPRRSLDSFLQPKDEPLGHMSQVFPEGRPILAVNTLPKLNHKLVDSCNLHRAKPGKACSLLSVGLSYK